MLKSVYAGIFHNIPFYITNFLTGSFIIFFICLPQTIHQVYMYIKKTHEFVSSVLKSLTSIVLLQP